MKGLLISLLILFAWFLHLLYCLLYFIPSFSNPFLYTHIILQSWLSTGMFISAHDAMHGTIHKNRKVNQLLGWIFTMSYGMMFFSKLKTNHFLHHKYPGTADDPDYNSKTQQFLLWWFSFILRYASILQFVLFAVIFNILLLRFNEIQLLLYWIIPLFLSTIQLFYVGTYLPHKPPHTEKMKPYNSRSQQIKPLWAFLSCYFFGYHYEHHQYPNVAWWKLYQKKQI